MGDAQLLRAANGGQIQVFPWTAGKVAVTTGPLVKPKLIYCVADGTIVITWQTGATSTRAMVAGEVFGLVDAASVAITNGTYDWAN